MMIDECATFMIAATQTTTILVYNALYFFTAFPEVRSKILEESKQHLNGTDVKMRWTTQFMLRKILSTLIKVLHPFMPFVTEEIWSMMPQPENQEERLLMVENWPQQ